MSAFRCGVRLLALLGVLVSLLLSVALVACGGTEAGDDTTAAAPGTDTGAGTDTDAGEDADWLAAAKEAVERGYEGTDRPLPTSSPEPVDDLNVWIVACTLQAEGCARPAQAAAEAARELGWEATVADGKFDPNEQANQIRNAISAGADVVIPLSIPCATVVGALQQAREAGVKIYGLYSRDCEDPLFDAQVVYADGETEPDVKVTAPALAHYMIAKTEGQAEIIHLTLDDGAGARDIGRSFADTITEACPTCVIHDTPFTGQDINQGGIQPLTAAALTKFPNANAVFALFDGIVLLGAGAAVGEVEAQGREILLSGFEGLEPNLQMIAAGGPQDVAAGSPAEWSGWAAIDGVNRLVAGEEQVDPGIGYQLIDEEHPPPTVPYNGNERSLGWKDNYRQIWGIADSG